MNPDFWVWENPNLTLQNKTLIFYPANSIFYSSQPASLRHGKDRPQATPVLPTSSTAMLIYLQRRHKTEVSSLSSPLVLSGLLMSQLPVQIPSVPSPTFAAVNGGINTSCPFNNQLWNLVHWVMRASCRCRWCCLLTESPACISCGWTGDLWGCREHVPSTW